MEEDKKYHPPRSHPWHRKFIDKDWQKANPISPSKKIHYETTDEDRLRYLNYFKTKGFSKKSI
jgi:hypothetical protein